ncbi:MAG: hypothetical protein ACOYN6_02490 [Ignavibacteria bacterium]
MAAEKNIKPVAIKTKSLAIGSEFIWNNMQNIDNFIKDIETPEVDIKLNKSINELISGIPTPFARAKMFSYAIKSRAEGVSESKEKGLMAFYKSLIDEWKGLIACLALKPQPIKVEKLYLKYSDSQTIERTANIFEPMGMLGNMLFDDKQLWCDQNEQEDKQIPYLQILRYEGILIGGTSPESLLFTAPKYKISTDLNFYSSEAGRFTDPLETNLNAEQYEKLYAYVKHIHNSITNYLLFFKTRQPDMQKTSVFLDEWLKDIKLSANSKGISFNDNANVPNFDEFKEPFNRLFNFKTQLFGKLGRISNNISEFGEGNESELIEVELSELLLDPETSTLVEILFEEELDADNYVMHYLKCETDRGFKYFSLPLSEKGLLIFQDHISELLSKRSDLKSSLTSLYDPNKKSIKVILSLDVNGAIHSFEKEYKNLVRIEGKNIIAWPNFVSKIWNKYYLYSELPHNSPEVKVYPLRADKNSYRLLFEKNNQEYKFKKISVNGKTDKLETASLLIEYDINKFSMDELQYEIYESEDPFKGLELVYKNIPCGYLIAKNLTSGRSFLDYRNINNKLNPVKIGFDFGSNNTCVSYAPQDSSNPELLYFQNRRVFLFGTEKKDSLSPASPHEVFFFQNEKIRSNQLKSMIMTHDDRRVAEIDKGPSESLINQVKGGFPVFERNIPVEDMTDTTCTAKMGGQNSYIKYNMKWSSDKKENAYKQSFLRALWLKIYAELIEKAYYPSQLIWAYPSSMNNQIIIDYNVLWNEVTKLNPIAKKENSSEGYSNAHSSQVNNVGSKPSSGMQGGFGGTKGQPMASITTKTDNIRAMTEAEAVCRYAYYGLAINNRSLAMGFDIGGSTTDILCLVNKYENENGIKTPRTSLIKQSSIKFAAGLLANATKKSKKFHKVLKSYCIKKGLNIHGINIPPERLNANTAPYYYNMIIDRLETKEELDELYINIASQAGCPELFMVNLFITGLIMFYAGQVAEQVRVTQEKIPGDYFEPIEHVEIGLYGKGSRMYDWISAVNPAAAEQYYFKCFGDGYGVNQKDIKYLNIFPSNPQETKVEVSFGLSRDAEIFTQAEKINEIVGEEGCMFNNSPLEPSHIIEAEYFKKIGLEFTLPYEYKRFSSFLETFYETCSDLFGLENSNYLEDIKRMRLQNYIITIPEYQLAKKSQEFDFVAPMIILEGMCYLDTILMNKLFDTN